MFKKIITFIGAAVLSVGFLAGCSLYKTNTPVYYSQIVATAQYKDISRDFTMKDLLTTYNSYASNLLQNGATVKEAVKQSIDIMVERFIFIEKLKETTTLTEKDLNEVKVEAYKSVNDSLRELETQIRIDWNRTVEEEQDAEESKRLRVEYAPFEQPFETKMIDGVLTLVKKESIDETVEEAGEFVQIVTDADISAEAMKRYNSQLKVAAKNEGITNLTEKQLFDREIDRIIKVLKENKYISKFQKELEAGTVVNTDAVVELYKKNLRAQRDEYANLNAYHKAVRADAGAVYYHPTTDNYLNVTHILVKFSEEQNAQIAKNKKELKANTITQKVYDQRLEAIKNTTVVKYEVETADGVFETRTSSLNAIYATIKNEVEAVGSNLNARAAKFNEFIYMYNDDDGIMNKEFSYTVNLNNDGGDDVMIKPFTEASKELHKNGELGAISELVFAEFAEGQFGFHIIQNLGGVELNQISQPNAVTWQALWQTKTQPSSDKTIFNVMYDKITQLNMNTRMSELVTTAKGQTEITYFESRYSNLWK